MRLLLVDPVSKDTDKPLYYVYEHSRGSEVRYVGKGKGNRAWSEQRTTKAHSDWVLDCIHDDEPFVQMVATRLTEEEALKLEKKQIRIRILEGEPLYNKTYNSNE